MWMLVFVLITGSFLLLIQAYKVIPIGIAYSVFVGLGTVGTFAVSVLFLGGAISNRQIFFLFILLIGIIGLKFTTKEEQA